MTHSLFVCLFLLVLAIPNTGIAADRTVLIVSDDEAGQTGLISNLYARVADKLSEHIRQAGFKTLQGDIGEYKSQPQDAADRDSQMLENVRAENLSRTGTEQIAYVARIRILANTILLETGTRVAVEIEGRMFRVDGGEVMALFELPVPGRLEASPDCDRNCIIQLLEQNTVFLADNLGRILADRLKQGLPAK